MFSLRFATRMTSTKRRFARSPARSRFEKMPGLRSKTFTFNPEAREAINFYVWDSEEAAKAFFNEELIRGGTGLYGVRPSIAFGEIAALVDNAVR